MNDLQLKELQYIVLLIHSPRLHIHCVIASFFARRKKKTPILRPVYAPGIHNHIAATGRVGSRKITTL